MNRLSNIAVVVIALCAFGATACQGSSTEQSAPATTATSSVPPPIPEVRPAPGDHRLELDFEGKRRSYVVHAPPGYDGSTALPLVVAMHFRPGNSSGIMMTSGLSAKADRENFLVVYPDGWNQAFNALICCGGENDVGFIKSVVEQMISKWKADPKRVYATGISNGGDMSYKLAVEAPDMFAAIAPVSGGFIGPKSEEPAYKPSTPVSVITFIGGKDQYRERMNTGLDHWQRRLACTPVGEPTPFAKGITLTTSKCGDGSDLYVYRLPEMGHSWPGAEMGALAEPMAGIRATDLLWDFFKTH